MMKPIYCSVPQIGHEEIDAVFQVFADEEMLVQGEQVYRFEEEFARYIGTRYAVAVNSGTDALYLTLKALGIGRGSYVLTSPLSFKATPETIKLVGANPCYKDVAEHTGNLYGTFTNVDAIIPVHLYGHPVFIERFVDMCERNNQVLIEDACQAHGAIVDNKKVGSFGRAGCFSFYATKNMTTGGNGGMITTNDSMIQEKTILLREHGGPLNTYEYGMNSRMNTINAAIGRVQLRKLDAFNKRRNEIAKIYNHELKHTDIQLPVNTKGRVYHLYVIQTMFRELLKNKLREQNIFTGIHYSKPLHQYPCLSDDISQRLPNAEYLCQTCLSLPCHPGLSDDDVHRVCDVITSVKEVTT